MATYRYSALDSQGNEVTDNLEAESSDEAIAKVRQMGFSPKVVEDTLRSSEIPEAEEEEGSLFDKEEEDEETSEEKEARFVEAVESTMKVFTDAVTGDNSIVKIKKLHDAIVNGGDSYDYEYLSVDRLQMLSMLAVADQLRVIREMYGGLMTAMNPSIQQLMQSVKQKAGLE